MVWPGILALPGTIDITKQLYLADVVIYGSKKINSDPLVHSGKIIVAEGYCGSWLVQRLANVMSRSTHDITISDLVKMVS